jgi:SAM-dependent methyltransferase
LSQFDRKKWDARYSRLSDAEIGSPSPVLMEALRDRDPVPCRALDLACGSGRNALALAEVGYEVDAVDISVEGIERGRRAARARNLKINWLLADLDRGLPVTETYDLIVMIRYLDVVEFWRQGGRRGSPGYWRIPWAAFRAPESGISGHAGRAGFCLCRVGGDLPGRRSSGDPGGADRGAGEDHRQAFRSAGRRLMYNIFVI